MKPNLSLLLLLVGGFGLSGCAAEQYGLVCSEDDLPQMELFLPDPAYPLTGDYVLWGKAWTDSNLSVTDLRVLGQRATAVEPGFRSWNVNLPLSLLQPLADTGGLVALDVQAWDVCGQTASLVCGDGEVGCRSLRLATAGLPEDTAN